MKTLASLALITTGLSVTAATQPAGGWTAGFQEGKAPVKSISQLAFGPDGILFLADSKGAAVIAVATGDTQAGAAARAFKVDALESKLAALLGSTPDQLLVNDLAVNPISGKAYLAVSRGRGPESTPVLLRVGADSALEVVGLDRVKFSKAELPDAPKDAVVGEGRRQSNPRMESITDLAFLDGQVVVAGLSNEEFASTLRSIPFPFQKVANGSTVEIYHGAHGQFETRAPIRTFVPISVGNQPHLLAAYTCTPLVQFPLKDLQPGAKVQGKTIAELGNRNRPLDMISYEKDGKQYLLLANSARGVMKVTTEGITSAEPIRLPVKDGATQGLTYETVSGWTGVEQLDRFGATHAMVVRKVGTVLNLESLNLP